MSEPWAAGLHRMLALVEQLPAHLQTGYGLTRPPAVAGAPPGQRILLCGMGGSAIAGDLARPLLPQGPMSLNVWRDYGLPSWAGPGDLVVASSYSGNTQETLSATAAALERGCAVVGVASGGELARLASSAGFPLMLLPGGLPPRAALGLGLGALLGLLERWGILEALGPDLQDACARLALAGPSRSWFPAATEQATRKTGPDRPDSPSPVPSDAPPDPDGNPPAALLARALQGRIPVIFTAGPEAHPAGLRLKAQFNENSKVPAFLAGFPELDHNDLVGWNLPADRREAFALVVVRVGCLGDALERRVAATVDLLRGEFASVSVVTAAGGSPLRRILSLVQYGDYVSCHLARWRGVDPVPVTRIEDLKRTLGGGSRRG